MNISEGSFVEGTNDPDELGIGFSSRANAPQNAAFAGCTACTDCRPAGNK
jgi:hypothetical protein